MIGQRKAGPRRIAVVIGFDVNADLVAGDVPQRPGEDAMGIGRKPLPIGVVMALRFVAHILRVPVHQRLAQGPLGLVRAVFAV